MVVSSKADPFESFALRTSEVCLSKSKVGGSLRHSNQVTGNLKSLNELAKQANAHHIVHTGDFGFYDDTSLERIAEK